jgi:hypothetical protein
MVDSTNRVHLFEEIPGIIWNIVRRTPDDIQV